LRRAHRSRCSGARSRDKEKPDPAKTVEEKEYYALNRDLESLGEFIERFLSKYKLWDVPIAIIGESYGGFRTAKLVRRLQETHGVGLSTGSPQPRAGGRSASSSTAGPVRPPPIFMSAGCPRGACSSSLTAISSRRRCGS
jgi:hypothetical protein